MNKRDEIGLEKKKKGIYKNFISGVKIYNVILGS